MNRKTLIATVSAAALSLGATAALAQTITLNGGGATLPQPSYQTEFTTFTNGTPTVEFSYDGVGSGGGQNAFLNDSLSYFNVPSAQYGTQSGTTVAFGASDAFLSSAQVSAYSSGRGVTDGGLIQIPMIGVPVTIAFNNSTQAAVALKLTDAQICGIFSGKITDWSQISTKSTAGTISVIYRSDGSGTSFLLTQHLNAVCTASNSSFATLPVPVTKTFASIFANSTPPSNFTGASGSGGVASAMLATTKTMGYLSPDFTSIAPNSSNTTALKTASLINGTNNVAYTPSVANTKTGLANPGAGSTNPTPPATATAAANPLNWIPAVPTTKVGYPIVGYTTWELATCYTNKKVGLDLISFLKSHYASANAATLNNNGFVPLLNTPATKYLASIQGTFLANTSGFNLNIGNVAACKGKTGR